jgi:ABC-2 type transport system permease protein
MRPTLALARRAITEAIRQPDALFMTFFIPIFFLVVNTGQAADVVPSEGTDFLEGQGYGAFQLPITLLLAASFGMTALFLVEEIENGYFDKLRAIPIPRYSFVMGRLVAEALKGVVISTIIVLLALPFGITIASGPIGFVLLIALSALWGVVYSGFIQLIALKARNAAAVNSGGLIFFPLLFLTPNLVPRDLLTEPMEVAASVNPVTYLMEALRSLILDDLNWAEIWPGFAVIAVAGAIAIYLNVRMIANYD